MSDATTIWVIAVLEVITAAGIGAYWLVWWRRPHEEPWLPVGYVVHEAPFVFPDMMLAVILVAAAVLQVTEQPVGRSLGLIAGGMLMFLGILDLAYFARTGMFKRQHEGIVNAGVVLGVLLMAVILVVRFA
ncbi:MAG: hypothetical protein PVJ28_10350 [Acidimicrobiia bacterium]